MATRREKSMGHSHAKASILEVLEKEASELLLGM